MPQLRPDCQCCAADLPGDSSGAFICSCECTFCRDCATRTLRGRCPNCGGELQPRPRRAPESGHFLLFYEVVPDYVERRAQFRDAHLRLAWAAQERGELVLGGAFADPVDGAALLFRGDSVAVAERFVVQDPYVQAGLVVRWSVRRWTTVVGEMASMPVRPG